MNNLPACILAAVALLVAGAAQALAGPIETIAGTGKPEDSPDGLAVKTNLGDPFGVELGPDGALYITEVRNHRVRRLDPKTGRLSTVAGTGKQGYSGDGGPANEAALNEPYEVRFDGDGNMYFVEMQNHLIRKVEFKTSRISTIAGTGKPGFAGDGAAATGAQFRQPHSIALDGRGGLYVADIGNHRIRRLDLKTGLIDTIAGNGEQKLPADGQIAKGNPILGPRALFIDGSTLWIALREGHSVWKLDLVGGKLAHVAGTGKSGYAGDGGPLKDAQFNGPKGISVGPDKNVYVVDTENQAIRRLDIRSNMVTTVAGGGPTKKGFGGDGGDPLQASFDRPHGICVGPDGLIYIGDTLNHRVRQVVGQRAAR